MAFDDLHAGRENWMLVEPRERQAVYEKLGRVTNRESRVCGLNEIELPVPFEEYCQVGG